MVRLTLKLRLQSTPEQATALKNTISTYTESFNRVCERGWKKRRINGVELHHDTYYTERAATGLQSQLVTSARVKATEALVSAHALKKKGKKVSCPHSRRCSIRYDNGRSGNIKLAEGKASLSSLVGRQHVTFSIPKHHADRINWPTQMADLRQDRKGRLWLHVVVQHEPPPIVATGQVVGVDLGVNRPAVTSQNKFFGKKRWREVEARSFRLRRALQAKGTKSAKRHLKKASGRLGRFRRDCDHVLSKRIVQSVEQGTTLALEDLTDIRSRMRVRKKQRRRLHSWSFARLKGFLIYKAALTGVAVAFVDPRYTSQKCSRCGHTARGNRKTPAAFACRSCGFQLNADLNAALNIAANHLASLAICSTGGLHVNQPTAVGAKPQNLSPNCKPPALAGGS